MGDDQTVKPPYPGYYARKIAKTILVSSLIFLTVIGSIGPWLPGLASAFGMFPSSSPLTEGTCSTAASNYAATSTNSTDGCSPLAATPGMLNPNVVGAGPVPNLSLPKTVLSSVDSSLLTAGVTQASTINLTLYNYAVSMRLLGGPVPHDEILTQNHRVLSSYLFWGVQANVGGIWTPLPPVSNNFTILGTNTTGTFLTREMSVSSGSYSGILDIVYKATSAGPLKWDLEFTPVRAGEYRIGLTWLNVTNTDWLFPASKQFTVNYPAGNYTLDWSDISTFSTSQTVSPGQFVLSVDLGQASAGSTIRVDPSIITTNVGYSYDTSQRRVFYEPNGGYYWVFYYDGSNNVYRNSPNGIQWSASTAVPSGVNGQPWIGPPYNPDVFNFGQTVVLVGASYASGSCTSPCSGSDSLPYVIGTISGSSISWGTIQIEETVTRSCNAPSGWGCGWDIGMTYVDAVRSSTGQLAFSYLLTVHNLISTDCGSNTSEVAIIVDYNGGRFVASCPYSGIGQSIVLPSNSQGQVRVVYALGSSSSQTLQSRWFDGVNAGPVDSLGGMHGTTGGANAFSAVSDANYGIHVLFRGADNNATYAYHPSGPGSSWAFSRSIFSVSVTSAPIMADYSTNDVYAFGVNGSSIVMKSKPLGQSWSDRSIVYAITGRVSPSFLGSNFASSSSTANNQALLVWTESSNLLFASIPMQTAWSPYSAPPDPWNGNGLAPYGQYFANLGEYVSPSTGMLTVKQTDLSVPGRGLNLDFARVYNEPYSFLNGAAYNYESDPWAPMGNGWQLNFPWMSNTNAPQYIHLNDGQGYNIPNSFWAGATATFENHQGENFRLVRVVGGSITLYDKTGTSYNFDTNHRLNQILDATGNNTIIFAYTNNMISCITDTVGRAFTLTYSSGLLQSLKQVTGTCASPGSTVRTVNYANNGQSLTSVTDPAGRVTYYSYNATGSSTVAPWLLARIKYPTSYLTNYTFTALQIGTQAYTYRVHTQITGPSPSSPVRQFSYSYNSAVGDQITNSTVTTYNGTQIVSYTKYAFSFLGDTMNVSDANHNLLSGTQQIFGATGEIPKEVVLVSDGNGHIGSYTNYYSYDLWGNQIYSRRVINPSSNWYHESFNAYYNNAEPPGFYAFQDSFSRSRGTASDNSWNETNGYWMVSNGVFNGTQTGGQQESVFAWYDLKVANVSIQAKIFVTRQSNITAGAAPRVGLFAHYPGTGTNKWAMVLIKHSDGTMHLDLFDEWGQMVAQPSCNFATGIWYTFNMTLHGLQASGSAIPSQGAPCSVSGTFPSSSPVVSATGFGLYAGGYSALFDDVQVATVSPYITSTGFSNSFIQSGAPGPVGLNTWLATTKPPVPGWNTTANWLAASAWSQAYPSQNYGATPWGTLTGWTDNSAQWIWASANANVSASIGPVWFRRTFSVPITSSLNVAIATDDTYVVYLDGSKLGTGNNWQQVGSYARTVSPGYHVLAINATNTGGPAGLLVSVKNTGTGQILFRSDATAGPNILKVAGTAHLQNGPGSPSEETYYGYAAWGGVSQAKQFYTPTGGSQWLTTSRTYDSYGNLKTLTDARGNTTSYGYSLTYQSAYLTSANQTLVPGGILISQRYSYNFTMGTMRSSVDGRGYNTTYQYDILGRTTRINYPTGDYTAYTYNDAASYVDITNENGWKTRQIYDGLARQKVVDRFRNGVSYSNETYSYDWENKVVTQTDPLGNSTSFNYDALGRIIKTTQANGKFTQQFYNDTASWTRTTDEDLKYRCSTYDRLGRLVSVVEKASSNCLTGIVTNYYYTEAGNLVKVVNALSRSTSYTLDNLGRVIKTTYPDNSTETYTFDKNGNILNSTDRNGIKTMRSYDSLNRIKTITYCGTPITGTGFTYDNNGNPLQVTNENATVTYIYDARNRVLNETSAVNPATRSVVDLGCFGAGGTLTRSGGIAKTYTSGFTYNGELLNTIMYPTTTQSNPDITIKYGYDGLGRVLNATRLGTSTYYARSLTYYKNDQIKGIQFGNALIGNYTYDKLSRPLTITLTGTTTMSLSYGYNNTGTVASVTGTVNGATVNEQYRYDALRRLTNYTVTSSGATTTGWYEYDSLGNRVRQKVNSTITRYSYNSLSELTNSTKYSNPVTTISYSYDANGNMKTQNVTSSGTVRWRYTWDASSHLLKVTNSTGQALYAYDGMGRMVEQVEGANTWFLSYKGTDILYKYLLNTGNYAYVYAGGMKTCVVVNVSWDIYYYHTDALGSTRIITYTDSTYVYVNNYQPFGQDNGAAQGVYQNRATDKFTGKPYSVSTGLYYYYHRWYDPSIGRFIGPDPLAGHLVYPQSLNLYPYVFNSPASAIDPDGHDCFSSLTDFGGCAGDFLETLGPGNGMINIMEKLTGINTDQLVSSTLGPTVGQFFKGSRILSGGAFLASGLVAGGALIAPVLGIGGSGGAGATAITTVTSVCAEEEQECAQGAGIAFEDLSSAASEFSGEFQGIRVTIKDWALRHLFDRHVTREGGSTLFKDIGYDTPEDIMSGLSRALKTGYIVPNDVRTANPLYTAVESTDIPVRIILNRVEDYWQFITGIPLPPL